MFSKALLSAAFVSTVVAHQNWHQLWINGETPGYQAGIRMPPSNSPVTDVTSNDIVCNVASTSAAIIETVEANEGDTIRVQWDSSTHPGPITHMLFGPVDDVSTATGVGAEWFKIDELNNVNGKWANEIMQAVDMTHEFKLPMGLASGEYLLRSEMLALHGAQRVGGAEFYIGCAQLRITGTGSKGSCTPTIELPGAYSANDDNIYIPNVYSGFDPSNFTAPGGPVAVCGGSGGATPSQPSTSSTPSIPTNSTVTPINTVSRETDASPAATTSSILIDGTSALGPLPSLVPAPTSNSTIPIPTFSTTLATLVRPTGPGNAVSGGAANPTGGSSSGEAKLWYQCGGIGWTGATRCVSGASCVKQNDYYFQCLAQ